MWRASSLPWWLALVACCDPRSAADCSTSPARSLINYIRCGPSTFSLRSRRCPICSPQYPNLRRTCSRPVPMGLCAVSRWCEGMQKQRQSAIKLGSRPNFRTDQAGAASRCLTRKDLHVIGTRAFPEPQKKQRLDGGHDRDRTCDPYHVKVLRDTNSRVKSKRKGR